MKMLIQIESGREKEIVRNIKRQWEREEIERDRQRQRKRRRERNTERLHVCVRDKERERTGEEEKEISTNFTLCHTLQSQIKREE